MAIHPELTEILRCPLDHAPLTTDGDELTCTECCLRYSIVNGIPEMLPDEATPPADAPS